MAILFSRRRADVERALELCLAYRGTARVLAELLVDSPVRPGAQGRDVVSLSQEVCRTLGLDERTSHEVELTALLHDVGKTAIPPQILDKRGELSEEEWAVVQTHVVEGQRMVDEIGGALRPVARAVRASHERWDGNGYPDGLAGEEIPLAARIVGCCDALHAMTSDRPYRPAMGLADAVAELRSNAGTQFDPELVEVVAAAAGIDAVGSVDCGPRPAGARGGARPGLYPSLLGELEVHAEHIAAVAQATRELARAHDADEARRAICQAALRVSGASAAVLLEPSGEGRMTETGRAGGGRPSRPAALRELGLDHPRFIPDLAAAGSDAALRHAVDAASAHLEPVVREGELKAVVVVAWRDPLRRLPAPVAAMMTLLAAEAAVALERGELLARLHLAVRTDELTGILNRNAWQEQLLLEMARAEREGRSLCVAMLDIDHFKRFNDREGHLAGDELLKQTVLSWRDQLRLTDQLGRYGGDEFLALLPGCTLEDGQRLMQRLSATTAAGQTCSAGLAEWDGEEPSEALVRRADEALLDAKQRGRNQISLAA